MFEGFSLTRFILWLLWNVKVWVFQSVLEVKQLNMKIQLALSIITVTTKSYVIKKKNWMEIISHLKSVSKSSFLAFVLEFLNWWPTSNSHIKFMKLKRFLFYANWGQAFIL